MTQEKEIEQAAREYADVAKPYLLGEEMELVRNAFEAGAEWALANQWHSIENGDLPSEDKGDLDDLQFIVITKDSNQFLAFYATWDDENGMVHCEFCDDCEFILDAAYWCEIPKLQKGSEVSNEKNIRCLLW